MSQQSTRAAAGSRRTFAPLLVAGFTMVLAVAGAAAAAGAPRPACTAAQGQLLIDEGRYKQAVKEFTCVIDAEPTGVEGYRGRIEALLLLGQYSDAVRDYARVTAFVQPVHPDAASIILSGYDARLAVAPQDIPALTGASFARWWFFQYGQATQLLNQLLAVQPGDLYGNLFRGSSRMLGGTPVMGAADLETALAIAPQSADVRFIVADAYTYGPSDPLRALAEASLALGWGLDTPRIHAILGSAYRALGDHVAAANHIDRHIYLVTTELLATSPIAAGMSMVLDLVPGRTYEIPVDAIAGETIEIVTSSHDFTDTIAVLLAPDGSPVVGSDDDKQYFAAFQWTASATGTFRLRVTSFEAVNTGELLVKRN